MSILRVGNSSPFTQDGPQVAGPDLTSSERRKSNRHIAVFLLVGIEADGRKSIARVINISAHGAMIETITAFEIDQTICIEFRSDTIIEARVRWISDQSVGVEFVNDVSLPLFLTRKQNRLSRIKPRPPRFETQAPASLKDAKGNAFYARVHDISLHGACLTGRFSQRPGDEVIILIDGLSTRRAHIVWMAAEQIGVEFMKPLDFREFGNWLASER